MNTGILIIMLILVFKGINFFLTIRSFVRSFVCRFVRVCKSRLTRRLIKLEFSGIVARPDHPGPYLPVSIPKNITTLERETGASEKLEYLFGILNGVLPGIHPN